jgi:hypothetical protein
MAFDHRLVVEDAKKRIRLLSETKKIR